MTARTLAEQARQQSEDLYKGLFDAIDEGFCIIRFLDGPEGPDGDYIHIEADAYARHAGIPNVVGQRLRQMVPDEAWSPGGAMGPCCARAGDPLPAGAVATGRYLDLAAVRMEPAEASSSP